MNIAFFLKPKAQVAYLFSDYSLRQGLEKMRHHGYSAIPVINREGGYTGTVSEGDFLWYLVGPSAARPYKTDLRDMEGNSIAEIIKPDPYPPISINSSMEELLLMASNQNFVPVIDDLGSFIGIITRRDIIHYFARLHDETPQNRSQA